MRANSARSGFDMTQSARLNLSGGVYPRRDKPGGSAVAPELLIEQAQNVFFLLQQRTPPGAAGQRDCIFHMARLVLSRSDRCTASYSSRSRRTCCRGSSGSGAMARVLQFARCRSARGPACTSRRRTAGRRRDTRTSRADRPRPRPGGGAWRRRGCSPPENGHRGSTSLCNENGPAPARCRYCRTAPGSGRGPMGPARGARSAATGGRTPARPPSTSSRPPRPGSARIAETDLPCEASSSSETRSERRHPAPCSRSSSTSMNSSARHRSRRHAQLRWSANPSRDHEIVRADRDSGRMPAHLQLLARSPRREPCASGRARRAFGPGLRKRIRGFFQITTASRRCGRKSADGDGNGHSDRRGVFRPVDLFLEGLRRPDRQRLLAQHGGFFLLR